MAPSHLSSATSLSSPLCTHRFYDTIRNMKEQYLIDFTFNRSKFSFSYCRTFRYLSNNQLSGTIPPQIGNLGLLTLLYAQSIIIFRKKSNYYLHYYEDITLARCLCWFLAFSFEDGSIWLWSITRSPKTYWTSLIAACSEQHADISVLIEASRSIFDRFVYKVMFWLFA